MEDTAWTVLRPGTGMTRICAVCRVRLWPGRLQSAEIGDRPAEADNTGSSVRSFPSNQIYPTVRRQPQGPALALLPVPFV
jgi:hypothetical protein